MFWGGRKSSSTTFGQVLRWLFSFLGFLRASWELFGNSRSAPKIMIFHDFHDFSWFFMLFHDFSKLKNWFFQRPKWHAEKKKKRKKFHENVLKSIFLHVRKGFVAFWVIFNSAPKNQGWGVFLVTQVIAERHILNILFIFWWIMPWGDGGFQDDECRFPVTQPVENC